MKGVECQNFITSIAKLYLYPDDVIVRFVRREPTSQFVAAIGYTVSGWAIAIDDSLSLQETLFQVLHEVGHAMLNRKVRAFTEPTGLVTGNDYTGTRVLKKRQSTPHGQYLERRVDAWADGQLELWRPVLRLIERGYKR